MKTHVADLSRVCPWKSLTAPSVSISHNVLVSKDRGTSTLVELS